MAIADFFSPTNGFNLQTATITSLVGTSTTYAVKNYNINRRILEINEDILKNTEKHLEANVLSDVLAAINCLCDLQRENNDLLRKISENLERNSFT